MTTRMNVIVYLRRINRLSVCLTVCLLFELNGIAVCYTNSDVE